MTSGISRRGVLRAGAVSTAAAGVTAAVTVPAPAAAAAAAAATAGPGWISVLDHGAAGDGITDDTAAIRRALDAARATTPHRSVCFPAGYVYRTTGEIVASGLIDAVISGYGATVKLAGAAASASGGKAVLKVLNCQRFKLIGLTLHDSDRAQQYNGVRIMACSGVTVEDVTVRDVRFNGIIVFDPVPGTSREITITGCTTKGTRFGISSNGRDVRIVNNHVAMDWPSTSEAAAKRGVWSAPSDYYDGICVWAGADRTVVSANTITECGQAGVYTEAVTNLVVADNTVTGCQLRGIEIDGTRAADGTATGTAIGVSITGNIVTNCIGHINLVRARDITVVANRLHNPNPQRAVSCIAVNTGTSRTVVSGNHAHQAHASFPAVYVAEAATEVTLAWNAVQAAVPYQAPPDTVIIERSGAGQIRTPGKIIAGGGIGVGNSVEATTPGAVVRKIEVFSSTGTSLGWIPVYNSIS